MNIDFSVDTTQLEQWIIVLFDEQLPFATSRAINAVALEFQKAQRSHMGDIFTIRRKAFRDRSVKIKPFANKRRLEAMIAIDSPRGRSDIFAKFEDQTRKGPFRGRSVAVPTKHVPRTAAGVIKNPWRPKALLGEGAGRQHGVGPVYASRGDVYQGLKQTFLIRRPGGRGTIFRRTRGGVVPLYQLVPEVGIEPELQFVRNAIRAGDRYWVTKFEDEFGKAVITARSRPTRAGRALRSLSRLAA